MEQIKLSISNGQWKQAVAQVRDHHLDIDVILQAIQDDPDMHVDYLRLIRCMISFGYLIVNNNYDKEQPLIRIDIERYGEDIDGNRGTNIINYKFEDDDIQEIESQILEYIQATKELPNKKFTVYLIDPYSEDTVEFDINPFKYIAKSGCLEYLADCLED